MKILSRLSTANTVLAIVICAGTLFIIGYGRPDLGDNAGPAITTIMLILLGVVIARSVSLLLQRESEASREIRQLHDEVAAIRVDISRLASRTDL